MTAPLYALTLDEVATRADLAARYAEAAAALAAAGDVPGMTHSLACAARVILAATEAAATLRPTQMEAPR
jgi:hypothetical protein